MKNVTDNLIEDCEYIIGTELNWLETSQMPVSFKKSQILMCLAKHQANQDLNPAAKLIIKHLILIRLSKLRPEY